MAIPERVPKYINILEIQKQNIIFLVLELIILLELNRKPKQGNEMNYTPLKAEHSAFQNYPKIIKEQVKKYSRHIHCTKDL